MNNYLDKNISSQLSIFGHRIQLMQSMGVINMHTGINQPLIRANQKHTQPNEVP